MESVASPILTITAADPTGVSGVQADVNTMMALGCHAVTAVRLVSRNSSMFRHISLRGR